jgi:hypothetical protein
MFFIIFYESTFNSDKKLKLYKLIIKFDVLFITCLRFEE